MQCSGVLRYPPKGERRGRVSISLRSLRGCHFVPKKENPLPLKKLRSSSILVSSDSSSIFLRVGVLLVDGVARGVAPVGDAVTLLLMLRVI